MPNLEQKYADLYRRAIAVTDAWDAWVEADGWDNKEFDSLQRAVLALPGRHDQEDATDA